MALNPEDLLQPHKRKKAEPRTFTREPVPQLEPVPDLPLVGAVKRAPKKKRFRDPTEEEDAPPAKHAEVEEDAPREEQEEKVEDVLTKLESKTDDIKPLDPGEVRQLVLRFEKAVNKNVEMRSKFPDKPDKFMDSEIALDEAISSLHALAAVPDLYPVFVEAKAIPTLLTQLTHENTDIGIAVINLLSELLDGDTIEDEEEEALMLVESLAEHNGIRVIINLLDRLDESQKEDVTAVHNILSIIENLVDIKAELSQFICKETKALDWLLARLKKDEFDANKQYASEIISVFLQTGGDQVKRVFGEKGGIKVVVKAVAKYRKVDPADDNETEYVENLFHTLCFALNDHPDNQALFAKASGLDLLIAMIKRKNYSKSGALKTLDFALNKCQPNCETFVEPLKGLKTLFAAFMGKGVKKKYKTQSASNDEHIVSVIAQLFMHLSDTRYYRLLRKFQENEYEKVERLIELYEKYYRRLERAEKAFRLELKSRIEVKSKEEEDEDLYLRRLDAGLFTLQLVAFVLGFVATCGEPKIKERIIQLLNQKDSSLDVVKGTLEEYLSQMGNPKWGRKMKTVLESIIAML